MSKPATSFNKLVYHYVDIEDKIIKAVDTIADPIKQTMGPKGGNVIYEDHLGNLHMTNDGVTIARNIQLADPVENAIIEVIKSSSLQTNSAAGDGTSSTVLWSSILIKEGLKLVNDGVNQVDIKNEYNKFADSLIASLKSQVREVKSDKELEYVAMVSASNDVEIAKNVVKVVKFIGSEGHCVIEAAYSPETKIIEDHGFIMQSGAFALELLGKQPRVFYKEIPVLITDKKLYYKQEAEAILNAVADGGYDTVLIVAPDFIGEALPFFVANHNDRRMNVILLKQTDSVTLEDLAIYLGGEVVSDKKGSLVNNLKVEQFAMAKAVVTDNMRSVITRYDEKNSVLEKRIKDLQEEMEKVGDKESGKYDQLRNRISSLTRGQATVRVGGRTPIETNERIFRYEDAINATRVASKDGYVVGGGIAVLHAMERALNKVPHQYQAVFTKICEANLRQILTNCGGNWNTAISDILKSKTKTHGYNALTGQVEDLLKVGIIEPFSVVENVIKNSVSIANAIISSRYIIVNEVKEENA